MGCANCPLIVICSQQGKFAVCADVHCNQTAQMRNRGFDYPSVRCPNHCSGDTLRRKSFSSRILECRVCGEDVSIPLTYAERVVNNTLVVTP